MSVNVERIRIAKIVLQNGPISIDDLTLKYNISHTPTKSYRNGPIRGVGMTLYRASSLIRDVRCITTIPESTRFGVVTPKAVAIDRTNDAVPCYGCELLKNGNCPIPDSVISEDSRILSKNRVADYPNDFHKPFVEPRDGSLSNQHFSNPIGE